MTPLFTCHGVYPKQSFPFLSLRGYIVTEAISIRDGKWIIGLNPIMTVLFCHCEDMEYPKQSQ